MQQYSDVVLVNDVPGGQLRAPAVASVLVKVNGGSTATIYSDNGVTPKTNPITADSSGEYSFYAADGLYDLVISVTGYATETKTAAVRLFDPSASTGAAGIGFLQSGIATPKTWTVSAKLQESFISAGDSAASGVTAKIDEALAAASGRLVIIPPDMGAGEPTSVPAITKAVLDLRGANVTGAGNKVAFNFVDSVGHLRFVVFDDQTSPTLSNAAAFFMHRPTGTLPNNASGEGMEGLATSIGTLSNTPTGYTLVGVEGAAAVVSLGQTLPDVRGGTFNVNTGASSTTNVTNLTALQAQAPVKGGSGTVTNACAFIAEAVSAVGSTKNLSIWSKGDVQFDTTLLVTGLITGNSGFYSLKAGGTAVELANSINSSGIKSVESGGVDSNLAFFMNGQANVIATIVAGGLDLSNTKVLKVASVQVVGARRTGWSATTGTEIRTNFGDASLSDTSQALRALVVDLKAHGIIGA